MIEKNKISKKEYKAIIDEILLCQNILTKTFDIYTSNTIARLIEARIKLAQSTIDYSSIDAVLNNPKEEHKQQSTTNQGGSNPLVKSVSSCLFNA